MDSDWLLCSQCDFLSISDRFLTLAPRGILGFFVVLSEGWI